METGYFWEKIETFLVHIVINQKMVTLREIHFQATKVYDIGLSLISAKMSTISVVTLI